MTQPEQIALELLARYFDDAATPEEVDLVRRWIGESPDRRAVVAELFNAWKADARRLNAVAYDVDRALARVTATAQQPRRSAIREPSRAWSARPVAAWAAVLVVAVGFGAWQFAAQRATPPAAEAATASAERVYRTKRAQRAIIRLTDGTEVTLNAASLLRVPADFGVGKRDLHLEGEAYFVVTHDSTAPFTVHTARGIARDLGTRFNVAAYGDERTNKFEVVVAEGAVAIAASAGKESLVLRAAEAGWLTNDGELRSERGINISERLAWTVGRLEFRNVPLREVLPVMSRWYDVELTLGDAVLADYPLTVTLTGESLTEAVQVVALALNARVELRGSRAVFHPRSGGSP